MAQQTKRSPSVHAIGFASSTGGPAALTKVLSGLAAQSSGSVLPPIFITQHMLEEFTELLAEQLARHSGLDCREAEDGEKVAPGRIYLAPGDCHMVIGGAPDAPVISLLQTPPVHFCRPAADPMLESLAIAYGKNTLAVILTGMGTDGSTGCKKIKAAGGTILVQDAASSAVWGMPGAVAAAGDADAAIPLDDMATAIIARLSGKGGVI